MGVEQLVRRQDGECRFSCRDGGTQPEDESDAFVAKKRAALHIPGMERLGTELSDHVARGRRHHHAAVEQHSILHACCRGRLSPSKRSAERRAAIAMAARVLDSLNRSVRDDNFGGTSSRSRS
jgi:hypothetical protein